MISHYLNDSIVLIVVVVIVVVVVVVVAVVVVFVTVAVVDVVLFQSPLYASGTVFCSISHLLRHLPSSALA